MYVTLNYKTVCFQAQGCGFFFFENFPVTEINNQIIDLTLTIFLPIL